jgi:hypothetical protein
MDSEKHGRGGIRGRTRSKLREPAARECRAWFADLPVTSEPESESVTFLPVLGLWHWQAASGQVAALGRPGAPTPAASSGTRQLGAGYGLPTPGRPSTRSRPRVAPQGLLAASESRPHSH